jgi:hypothetical protein
MSQTASERAAYKKGQIDFENGNNKNPYSMEHSYELWRAWMDGFEYAHSFKYFD